MCTRIWKRDFSTRDGEQDWLIERSAQVSVPLSMHFRIFLIDHISRRGSLWHLIVISFRAFSRQLRFWKVRAHEVTPIAAITFWVVVLLTFQTVHDAQLRFGREILQRRFGQVKLNRKTQLTPSI